MQNIKKVSVILIGNEILNGKIQDKNLKIIAEELEKFGIRIERCVIIRDKIDAIRDEIKSLKDRYDLIITTGGIGPTHDDLTVEAVALALNKKLIEYEELIERVKKIFGENPNKAMLKMALQPEGAKFFYDPVSRFPTVMVDNVVMFPGIPQLLKAKLPYFLNSFLVPLKNIYKATIVIKESNEWELENIITEIANAKKEVEIGSYPIIKDKSSYVEITIDGDSKKKVEEVLNLFLERLPKEKIEKISYNF